MKNGHGGGQKTWLAWISFLFFISHNGNDGIILTHVYHAMARLSIAQRAGDFPFECLKVCMF
jgi:hypothetical protein